MQVLWWVSLTRKRHLRSLRLMRLGGNASMERDEKREKKCKRNRGQCIRRLRAQTLRSSVSSLTSCVTLRTVRNHSVSVKCTILPCCSKCPQWRQGKCVSWWLAFRKWGPITIGVETGHSSVIMGWLCFHFHKLFFNEMGIYPNIAVKKRQAARIWSEMEFL